MKRFILLFSFFVVPIVIAQKQQSSIGFIENKGQIVDQKEKPNEDVKYLLNTNGLNVQLRKNGFSYDIYETKKVISSCKPKQKSDDFCLPKKNGLPHSDDTSEYHFHRIDIDFVNSNPKVTLIADGKSTDYDNYYNIVSKPEGVLNVHKFEKVTYVDIYPNIDVVFFIPEDKSKPVEYNFIVKPNGRIADIQMKFSGAKTQLIDNKIKMDVRFGMMEETLPMSWTEHDKKEVAIGYKKIAKNIYGFETDESLDKKTTIIDPVPIRLWGTYYGGSGNDAPRTVEVDLSNNVYIGGDTSSTNNMATAGSYQSTATNAVAYIAKLDPNGLRVWGSYYRFYTGDFVLDNLGNIYVFGQVLTANTSIPSVGCFQPVKSSYNDAFLVKLNNMGFKQWGTYYGSNENEEISDVCFDPANNVYVVGLTNSTTNVFSTPGAYQLTNNSNSGFQDSFIAKFDPNGNRIWGTYYGGPGSDGFYNVDISTDGYLYMSGTQNSTTGIATPGSYQPTTSGGSGGMIVKFDLNGQRIWGTYICDVSYVYLAKLKGDNLYLSGRTWNHTEIATAGTLYDNFQTLPSSTQVSTGENTFIITFNVQTQQKVWGSYFIEYIRAIDVNSNDDLYFSGDTHIASGITTPDAYMPTLGFYMTCYLMKLNSAGQKVWGTYYGGPTGQQYGFTRVDYNNDIYLFGTTASITDIATPGAAQMSLGSNPDTFLVKFKDCLSATQAASNNPCIGGAINLTASGGTVYTWTGPNGFTSIQQNPTINNATATQSGVYSCAITGSGGCDNTVTFNVLVGDVVKPVPNVIPLPTVNGDCNTTISIPTATDNCAGNINGTTTNPLSYSLPGNYTITWNYNDGNGNTETQTQSIVITAVSLPTSLSPQKFCIQQSATLNDISITGTNIKWYDAATAGNLLTGTTVLQNGITYYASQTLNNCESLRIPITIQIQSTPVPIGTNQSFCATQNAILNDVTVNGTTIKWYSSAISTIDLPTTTLLADNTTYYATQTLIGCESVGRVPITISLIYTLNAGNYATTVCDNGNDNMEPVVLSDFDSFLINSTIGNTFTYYGSANGAENQIPSEQFSVNHSVTNGLNSVYVRIDSSNGCHQVVELQLTLVNMPVVAIPDEIILCEGERITVNAGSGFDSYNWSTGDTSSSTVITQAGNYTVTVTQNHGTVICSSTRSFTVALSNAPSITSIHTVDWTDTENSITINLSTTSVGEYEYSIDGENFQDSNIFNGLPNGTYTVTVRDKKGCGISVEQVFLLNYPRFFTPNGDGYHDNWFIQFSQFEPNFEVKIFDRYGKLIKIMNNVEFWDGTFNGKTLPSDDYWFDVTRNDGRIHKGHFAMKR
jgi:gliding motility-associated-like protein